MSDVKVSVALTVDGRTYRSSKSVPEGELTSANPDPRAMLLMLVLRATAGRQRLAKKQEEARALVEQVEAIFR